MTFVADANEIYEEQYDEFQEVYGCTAVGRDDLVRCCDCTWESCPMRGKNREVA
ncbi:hypothetical protein M0R72_19675 [Candidatus Pacearchaeota archaeon]|jgi:hypothetical protein|nr:hypothetical protein [Candidatus Pacearchaeota archaeon]